MNMTLYLFGLKRNYKLWLIFAAVLTMYVTVVTMMYDPNMSGILDQFTQVMPELMAAFGMGNSVSTLLGFLSNYLYGFLLIIFPMVFIIMLSNQLVAKYVDNSSMSYLLASPNTRSTVIRTQIMVLLTLFTGLMLYATVLGIICSQLFFPGELDIPNFLLVNLGVYGLLFAMSGLCFLLSCIANETRFVLTTSISITVFFYMMQMLAEMGERFDFLKYLTLFTLFNPSEIINGNSTYLLFIPLLFLIGIILFIASNQIFKRKDLSI